MNFKTLLPIVISAGVGAVIALVVSGGGGTTHSTTTVYQGSAASQTAIPTSFNNNGGKTLSINQVYRQDSPGVVDITETSSSNGPFGAQVSEGEGAGVVYDKHGDILTDEHVVSNAQQVTVHFQDGTNAKATVLGTDPSTDVAVIKVNVPASQLHPLPFADSSAAQVGDPVVAIGSPFSQAWTTTAGIVSAIGRPITAPNQYTITGAIQTDAAINPGNSGGPLIDAQGKVIGLADQIETNNTTVGGEGSSSGVGFATPGNEDIKISNAIIAGHPIRHAYVGVCLNPATNGGAQIASGGGSSCASPVAAGSPAAAAGLQPGDTITAIDGHAISSTEGFIETVDTYKPGQAITLSVNRNGQQLHVTVTLGVRPATSPSAG